MIARVNSKILILLVAALGLTGCSSVKTKVDSGPIQARTFSFIAPNPKAAAEFTEKRKQVHGMIQAAITRNLASKGVTKVEAQGDITVAYLVIVGNNGVTMSVSDYFGYGRDASGLKEKAHSAYTSNSNPNYYEAGTLLIDLVDSSTYAVLRRSHASRPLLRNAPEDVKAEYIQEIVDAVLKGLRIVP